MRASAAAPGPRRPPGGARAPCQRAAWVGIGPAGSGVYGVCALRPKRALTPFRWALSVRPGPSGLLARGRRARRAPFGSKHALRANRGGGRYLIRSSVPHNLIRSNNLIRSSVTHVANGPGWLGRSGPRGGGYALRQRCLMGRSIPSHWRQLKYSTYPRRFASGAPSAVHPKGVHTLHTHGMPYEVNEACPRRSSSRCATEQRCTAVSLAVALFLGWG